MRLFSLIFFLSLTGCATKYMLPGNRFITPESQGDAFRGQIEIQKTTGNELSANYEGSELKGVTYSEVPRTGFLLSNSFFNNFDLVWSHTAGANSMIGGKFQFYGGSRVSKESGHKLALTALIGSNEHETDDQSVEFKIGGQEYLINYGYRFTPQILAYSSLSQGNYNFDGHVRKGSLNGQRPNLDSHVISLSGGFEGDIDPIFAKLEFTYQTINTDKTRSYSHYITGLSIGYAW